MPLNARAKRFLDILAASNPPSALSLSVPERRAALEQMMRMSGPGDPSVQADDRPVPGPDCDLVVRTYTPAGVGTAVTPGVVYFHGGGLVAGSIDTHDAVGRALASSSGYRALSVGYRLAPEHRFPAAVDDAVAVVRHVLTHASEFHLDATRIAVCGDSAGGTLAAVVCQELAGAVDPQPALQVLLCPILDYAGSTDSRREFASGYLVDQATLDHDLLHYLPPNTDPGNPRISPLRATIAFTPPRTLIHTAEFDPLRDEGRAYADHLAAAGGQTAYTCHPGMIHLFYGLGGVIPDARIALTTLGEEIRKALG